MRLADIGWIGWIHSLACLIALATGLLALLLTKGTPRHRLLGRWYSFAMAAANLTALAIYKPIPGLPAFTPFHWMAVGALAWLAIALYAAPRQRIAIWAYLHPLCFLASYYMLVGGLINELFARTIGFSFARPPLVVTLTQEAALLLLLLLAAYFAGTVSGRRRRHRFGESPAAAPASLAPAAGN